MFNPDTIDTASLGVVHYPHPVLRQKSEPVEDFSESIRQLAHRMIELMIASRGVGLAANQVAVPLRIFVASHTAEAGDAVAYVNPELTDFEGTEPFEEGCLSFPDVHAEIIRPRRCTIRAYDLEGKPFERTSDELEARIWQHETDHLDGMLFIDRMSPIDKMSNRKQIKALETA